MKENGGNVAFPWRTIMCYRLLVLSIAAAIGFAQSLSETRPRTESYAGNGVDTATGAFVYNAVPLPFLKEGRHNITLMYDSSRANDASGELGFGWVHSFEYRLAVVQTLGTSPVTVFATGKQLRFGCPLEIFVCNPLDLSTRFDRMTRTSNFGSFQWQQSNNSVLDFDNRGVLLAHADAGDRRITIARSPDGRILQLRGINPYVSFGYNDAGGARRLTTLSDDANRTTQLLYGSDGRLAGTRGPVYMDDQYAGSSSAVVSASQTVINTINVTRAAPVGLVRFTGTIGRTLPQTGPAITDLRLFLRAPNGRTAPIPGYTTVGTAGNNKTITFHPYPTAIDDFYGQTLSGAWQVLGSTNTGSTTFTFGLRMLASDVTDDVTRFVYVNGLLAGAIGPDGKTSWTNQYDNVSRVIAQDDGVDGNKIATFSYQPAADGSMTTAYTDRTGQKWLYVHDKQLNLLSQTDPLGHQVRYAYDANGLRTRVTDPNGNATEFEYDDVGRLTNVYQRSDSGARTLRIAATYSSGRRAPMALTDGLGRRSQFTSSSDFSTNFRSTVNAEGHTTQRTWGGTGDIQSITLPDSAQMTFEYSNGFLARVRHPEDSGSSRQTTFDAIGRLTSVMDADGAEEKNVYNPRLQILQQADPAGRLDNKYDVRGRLISATDRDNHTTTYVYDGNDNRVAVIDGSGTSRYAYDGEDRLVAETDGAGNTIRYEYDAAGRMVAVVDAEGNITRTEYDAAGNVTGERDAAGKVLSRMVYDYRNLPVKTIDALGQETNYSYDAAGQLMAVTDALGRTTNRIYDRIGRLIEVRDPLGRRATQSWTADNRIESMNDARSASTTQALVQFRYDKANRITEINAGAGAAKFTYSKADQQVRGVTPAGRRQDFAYDDKGNLTNITAAWSGVNSVNVQNAYDNSGNLVRVSATSSGQSRGTLARAFDERKRIVSFTDSNGSTIRYAYDASGNVARITYPDGKVLRYGYDKRGRITTVTDWANRITRLTWDLDGGVSRIAFPNGTVRTMSYDRNGRLLRRTDASPSGATIVDYRYGYDAAGQMQTEVNSAGTVSLADISEVAMSYSSDNRLATYNGQAVNSDADGNMTRGPLGSRFADFVYDTRNNLVSVNSGAQTGAYTYDAEDRLVRIEGGGRSDAFVVNPAPAMSQIITRRDRNGTETRYVWAVGLLYEETGSGIRVYHYDDRGNTVAFSDSTGNVTGQVTYSPFGTIMSRAGNTESPFLMAGLFGVVTDPNGLAYMRYRWYSPQTRRFLNADAHFGSIASMGSLNRYAYGGNNPVMRVDPEGQFWHVVAGALIGAVANVAVQAVTDIFVNKKFSGFEKYGAVAAGGAVAGAIATACGGILCAGLAGAANSTVSGLVESGLKGQKVDFDSLGREAAVGGAFGLLGGAGGKLFSRATGRVDKWTLKEAFQIAPKQLPAAYAKVVVRRAVARQFINSALPGLAKAGASGGLQLLASPQPATGDTQRINARAKYATEGVARQEVNESNTGTYGEHKHWTSFLDAMRLSGMKPFLNSNDSLAVF